MTDDYSEHPKSIAEHKANKSSDAGAWSPRDALISALRAIDSGELNATHLIVVIATPLDVDNDNSGTQMNYYNAIPSTFYGLGMLVSAIKDYK